MGIFSSDWNIFLTRWENSNWIRILKLSTCSAPCACRVSNPLLLWTFIQLFFPNKGINLPLLTSYIGETNALWMQGFKKVNYSKNFKNWHFLGTLWSKIILLMKWKFVPLKKFIKSSQKGHKFSDHFY